MKIFSVFFLLFSLSFAEEMGMSEEDLKQFEFDKSKLFTLSDYFEEGSRRLGDRSPSGFVYVSTGSDEQFALQQGRKAFKRWVIRPRFLIDVSNRSTAVEILGKRLPFPVGVSPMALHKLVHPEGECETAKGAAAAGTIFAISTFSTRSIEDVRKCAPGARLWFQLYFQEDRELNVQFIDRAEKAGYEAIILTVDAELQGKRVFSLKSPIVLPAGATFANFDPLEHVNTTNSNGFQRPVLDAALTWDVIRWIKNTTTLKVFVKGVLTAEDAILALDHGADGIWVSNHGGRQLDAVEPPIQALPAIVEAVGDKIDVFMDGGISLGTDVFKAISLGAKMVFVGRAALWGLAVGGAPGVEHSLKILKDELDLTMALAGTTSVSQITRQCVKPYNPL